MANIPEIGFLREVQIIGQRAVSDEEAARYREALAKAIASGDEQAIKRAKSKPLHPRQAVPGIVPCSRSSWWNGVRSGRFPSPVKLGPRTTAWRLSDIKDLINNGIA
jgi:predicted DNA-binding transcriptional regulator AlpA